MEQLADGALISGRYHIEGFIGKGGIGAVYRAVHTFLRRHVALKLLRAEKLGDVEILRRFEREARAASRIKHPNVTEVFDFGYTEQGTPYLAMELIEGTTLAEHIRKDGPLDREAAVDLVGQICRGVQAAHDVDVIHRDLKPQNVALLSEQGKHHVKVLDFGQAKLLDPDATQLTHEGGFGTPEYMAPEQIEGTDCDRRTDIYALGILLYELLVGDVPFAGSPIDVLGKQLEVPVPRASERAADPERVAPFEGLIERCTAKRREDRYASVNELVSALQGLSL
jgi:serine/threonine protein kinase